MWKNLVLVALATQFALAEYASCQSTLQPPSVVTHDPAMVPIQNIDGNVLPFVSGHSDVAFTARSRFETDGDCGQCNHLPCVCGDKKAQKKAKLQYKYWGYPELFCERPLGSLLRAHLDAQIAKGVEGQMILYRYDFFDADQPDADALKPAGIRTLAKIVDFASVSPTPIKIEATGNEVRDGVRRANVLSALSAISFPVAEEQVITIARDPFGISAEEAAASYGKMLNRTGSGRGSQGSGFTIPVIPLNTGSN